MTDTLVMPVGDGMGRAKEFIQRWYGEPLFDIWGYPICCIPKVWEHIESGLATYTGDARHVWVDGVLTEIPKNIALIVEGSLLVCPDGYDWSKYSYKRITRKTDKCWYVEGELIK